ncbi:hypothetical protein GCM10011349_03420 [Novosphingobium indicum]|mgnify:CR=1 FL=1|uniref:Glycosyltransferase RgtA/B/C/D-like domain-containing protein n=1 Tax=Novosphingobium indicum TaxID=462949 RepID=A0ABQ2J7R7_9SPHN|nr:hypothetical protein [Novosphingobium indicum]GGN41398.1 hypothetical protein GCM10011349_03420 [Novosphingobium indicum]
MHGTAKPDAGDKGDVPETAAESEATEAYRRKRDVAFWLGLFLSIVASLPVLVTWAPQMTDYPSHLAGYKVLLDHGSDPWLTHYFLHNWEWTGNLGAELLMVPLAPIFGLEEAGRLIVALIPFLTGLSIMAVAWSLRKNIGVGAILAFAMIWSPSLLMGFLNYSLSLAMALFAFALWVRMEGSAWRHVVFVPISFAVWLCHVSGWGIMGVLVFGYEWTRRRNWLDWRPFTKPWPLVFPIVPMLAGMGANSQVSYGRWGVLEYKWAILYKAMRSYDQVFDIASLCLVMLVITFALFTRRIDGRAGWAALLLFFLTLAVPRQIFGGDYADYRLSTAALLVACLAIDWPVSRWGLALAGLLFSARTAVTTVVWYQDAQSAKQLIAALDYVPEGAKVATAVAIPRVQWRFGPFEHFGSYAVVRRSAMENSNFALPDVHMLAMRETKYRFNDPTQRILYSPNQRIDLRKFKPARHADYLWFIGSVHPVAVPDGARIVYSTPNSFLARMPDAVDLANPADGG